MPAQAQWGVPEGHRAFLNGQLGPVLKLYHEGKREEALKELDRIHRHLVETSPVHHYFFTVVWWEGQTKTGNLDEEWGADLFRYLFEFRHEGKTPGETDRFSSNDCVLIGNLTGYLKHIGKSAEARSYILRLEKSLCEHMGMDTQCTDYRDLGPLFSFMEEARKREFPIRNKDLPGRSGDSYIYYPYIYGIGYAADAAMASGDWVRAAELYAWFIAYTDAYMEVDDTMRSEITQHTLGCAQSLAQICLMHGYPEEAVSFIERYLEQMYSGWYKVKPQLRLEAQLELAVLNLHRGIHTEGAMQLADMAAEQGRSFLFYDRWDRMDVELQRARIYHAHGHEEEAWGFIDEMIAKAKKDHNPYLWTRILPTAIDLAIADGSVRPELEDWFILALKSERLNGNKFAELPLYEKYAQFLASQGRLSEAIHMQAEAVRLARAMTLDSRYAAATQRLAEMTKRYQASLEKTAAANPGQPPQESGSPVADASAVVQIGESPFETHQGGSTKADTVSLVSIQPSASTTVALPGQPAYGRFYLLNPTSSKQDGTLILSGPIDSPEWVNTEWITVATDPDLPSEEYSRAISILPGKSHVLDLVGNPSPEKDEMTVECQWVPSDTRQAPATATWIYSCAETGKRTAVVDAHEIDSNPFYLIPVRHMLQRTTAEQEDVVDLSIMASSPMRIEIYEEESGKLLAVDANGNGDFMDKGDLIASDRDRNNWPDISFAKGKGRAAMVLYVRPLDDGFRETELTIQLRVDGEWQTDAIDLIRTGR